MGCTCHIASMQHCMDCGCFDKFDWWNNNVDIIKLFKTMIDVYCLYFCTVS